MLRVGLTAFALLTVALAGCVAPQLESASTAADASASALVPPAPDFDFTKVVDPDHLAGHYLADLHTAGHGLALAGYAPIQDILPPLTRGSITQVDVWENYAVVSGMEGGLAFAIVDITDAAKPKAVSYWPSVADGWTARFSQDGQYVFYGCQMLGGTGDATSLVKGDCKDPMAPHAPAMGQSMVLAIDVADKAHPKLVSTIPAKGTHNIFVTQIGGVDYVVTKAVEIIKFDRASGEMTLVSEVPGVHDASVHQHPITKDWLLFTGAGGGSWAIYDVNDPAKPEVVYDGGEAKDGIVGWHEQTMIPGVVDGRVVIALAGETGINPKGGVPDTLYFADITDPAKPTLLSKWKPPFAGSTPWISYQFSIHEIAATPTGQVAVSWYHGGVWVLDVSTKERQEAPVTLAAFQPHEPLSALPSTFAQTPLPLVPFVWGAGWDQRGYLVVPDMHTGLYLMEPEWGLHATNMTGGGQ
jgi:hypothetical protein